MKTTVHSLLFGILLVLPLFLKAQKKVEVTQEKINLSVGIQPAYRVEIPEGEMESVKKDWIKLIRQNTKSKVAITGTEINIVGTLIKDIYDKPFNIYSALMSQDSGIILIAAYEIDSLFFEFIEGNKTIQSDKINSSIKGMMRDFAIEQYKNEVNNQLNSEEKKLEKLNGEFESLNAKIENDRKEIKENEQNIKNSQDAIATNEKDNERILKEIDKKKEDYSSVKDDPELEKVAKSQLKDLEKEKKSIENNLENEQKNIITYQANIDDLNRAIENNLKLIEEKKTEITNQESIVKQVNTRLKGIK